MELYKTHSFARWLAYYLTRDVENIETHLTKDESDFIRRQLLLRKDFSENPCAETAIALVSLFTDSSFRHQTHYNGIMRLKKELPDLSDIDLLNLFAVLFSIADRDILSFPVREILLDCYPEIVLEIAWSRTAPVLFQEETDISKFEAEVYPILCDYALAYCSTDEIAIWGENYDIGTKERREPVPGYSYEEYEQMNCYVHLTDSDTVNRMKHASYLAGYHTTDVDRGVFFIGNLITFATVDLADVVTLQIVRHQPFDSFLKMYRTLGTAAFGFAYKNPEDLAQKTEAFFEQYYPEGPLALSVRRLPLPILKKQDFETLKSQAFTEHGV